MKKTERLVFYYDLSISASSRNFDAPKPISVRRAFELMQLVPESKRNKELSKGREFLYMSDWNWTDNTISILINKSDKNMSDPVFTNPQEKKRRTAEKLDGEGQDFSVHMVVQLPENDLNPALVIVEYCAGLGAFVVQRLLNQILNDAKMLSPIDFEQLHPDGSLDNKGKQKKYNVTFKCELDGHISDDLKDDLNHGNVQAIELITDKEQYTPFDEDGYIKEKCKTLVLTLKDEEHSIKDKYNRILGVFKKQKEDYSRAKVKFKTPTGIDRTVEMDTINGLAQAYVKKEKLDGFEFDLKASYDKFCEPILSKMKELLPLDAQ
ncbi:hypothetical protein [Chromobacterium vaccinii]|uniref:hypothetical protein n=1 Tax=Chromobacterium vaccinii TaxID=1108595 RepID=UPI001E31BB74|nr:hypothetical protein [Chromobacterium vaccinii]MCD4500237.1 hypothetical protein [Chromobacterium vaccinii]